MLIRPFERKDLEDVLRIDRIYPPTSRDPISEGEALRLHQANPNACLVAEKDGELVGFIFCEIYEGKCTVRYLQIIPSLLGEGIVPQLVDKIIELNRPRAFSFK